MLEPQPKNKRTLNRALPIALLQSRDVVLKQFAPVLQEIGLTFPQWRTLRVLNEYNCLPISKLSKHAAILVPSLSRIVKKMMEKNYITRIQSESDQRSSLISLTSEGEKLLADNLPILELVYDDITRVFGYGKSELLFELLAELNEKCHSLNAKKSSENNL